MMDDDMTTFEDTTVFGKIIRMIDNVRAVSGAEPTRIIVGRNQKRELWERLHVTADRLEIACYADAGKGCPVYIADADDELAIDTTPRERWAETEWGEL